MKAPTCAACGRKTDQLATDEDNKSYCARCLAFIYKRMESQMPTAVRALVESVPA